MSEQIDTAVRAARITALAAEMQLIASMAQDHVQKYGGWQCDFEHEFQKVRGQLDEAIQRAEQDNAYEEAKAWIANNWYWQFCNITNRIEIREDSGRLVCVIPTMNRDDKDPDEIVSDAHMGSAAPDLYEALDQLVQATEHLDPCPGTLDRAMQALAKARGEDRDQTEEAEV